MLPYGRTDRHGGARSRFSRLCDTSRKLLDCAAVRADGNTKRETIISLAEIATIYVDVATYRYDPARWPDFFFF